jgi:hypothetical protein
MLFLTVCLFLDDWSQIHEMGMQAKTQGCSKYLVVLNPAPDLERFSNSLVLNQDQNYADDQYCTPLRLGVQIKLPNKLLQQN